MPHKTLRHNDPTPSPSRDNLTQPHAASRTFTHTPTPLASRRTRPRSEPATSAPPSSISASNIEPCATAIARVWYRPVPTLVGLKVSVHPSAHQTRGRSAAGRVAGVSRPQHLLPTRSSVLTPSCSGGRHTPRLAAPRGDSSPEPRNWLQRRFERGPRHQPRVESVGRACVPRARSVRATFGRRIICS